ncbi:sugar phosphate isomerase/epimerase [Agreia sp. PsM10]|uniref:sugar phosphate isomerase/epimerase family protein n=1 Tax=Agreia sp. PsM10 TaxID=3030533 RepID=UPI00263BC4C2|nr:sugar phosphate isomerase/epimerase [Agreia sp. PsM10]MDN4640022.1 sugar phosphate isomerase/epimerase [Agreia sp. PsM10]
MTLSRSQFALNPIQWINIKADPADPASDDLWLFAEPSFREQYPDVLVQVRRSGFDATMMEVLDTQTLQSYARMLRDTGLRVAPGYCSVALPEDHGVSLAPGSASFVRWFDGVRRKAEESNFFGLSSVFLAPEVSWAPGTVRTLDSVAVGAVFDEGRLDRVIDVLGEAASVLASEGIRAGLHNHVGTWVETEHEIDRVLAAISPDLLGASFDVGHLAWAGMDPVSMLGRYSDRLVDLHIKDLDLDVAAASRATPTPYRTATDQGLFLEPGLGGMDLDGILSALPDGFGGWIIIEVDRASMEPFESAQVSRAWLEATIPA